jgi:16S rRNA (cytosine967-C5)-methyltransferase
LTPAGARPGRGRSSGGPGGGSARAIAVAALVRIDGGAYANLVLPPMLARSDLSRSDRAFATSLVYGTTRMQRACDWLVDRFLLRPPDATTRAVLRLGAYQLAFLATPPHAAVSATVTLAPGRTRGLVNAVLRKVADAGPPAAWPSLGIELSYPDWVVARLAEDLGTDVAVTALRIMNEAPTVTTRPDGYVQDLASQWVGDLVGPGRLALDLCAGPGGKATAIRGDVVALEVQETRAGLVATNAARVGAAGVRVVTGSGLAAPFRPGVFDRVLVDAPCSGLGVLRRRPDARWRVGPDDVVALASLQQRLVAAAGDLVRPGGRVIYSVCTLTTAETLAVDEWLAGSRPDLRAVAPPGAPWEPVGRGARLLPQTAGTDGMYVLVLERQ